MRPRLTPGEPLPIGSGLIEYWRSRLGTAEWLILETLAQAYLNALTKEEVAAGAGYEANGGGFNNALGRLRTLELVVGRGEVRASHNLFRGAVNGFLAFYFKLKAHGTMVGFAETLGIARETVFKGF